MPKYELPNYASLDFNSDSGYRVDCAPDADVSKNDDEAPAGWRFAETYCP